jgi:hypothetical protein
VVDELRGFLHRRIEAQIFMRVLAVFVSPGNFNAHEYLVRMNLFDGALFFGPVNVDAVAGL